MTNSDRWKKISGIFKVALELEPLERPNFLKNACGEDEELFQEVKSLLLSFNQADSLEKNAFEIIAENEKEILVGRKIGNYEIIRLVGFGGMGEVYLARDTRLERNVAIKLLASHYASQIGQVERFQQEARATSALNHPNILTVHDFGEYKDRPFIVSEFIVGETLRTHLVKNDLPLEKKLDVAIQIARGLAAAHEARIVHRDIKPENLMIREDGYLKILDFGLAKLTQNVSFDKFTTIDGLILGTVNYMSPEQASGMEFDHRTDLWSLGVVLYEMLTGKTPFDAETPMSILAAIIKSKTPNVELQGFNRIIQKALEKSKDHRYQSAKDFLQDLLALRSNGLQSDETSQIDTSNLPTVATTLLHFAPNNLTVLPTVFVGRSKEISSVKELLNDDNVRLVTLTGAGGTGKTRLALQVANEFLDKFTDGVYFVRLATITNPEHVSSAIAQTLNVKEAGNLSLTERLKENLRDKKMLLILDNFEQILSASSLVSELLASSANLKILVTSRAVLRLRGEHEFFVPTLSLPDKSTETEKISQFSAVKLFLQSARTVKSDFKLTPENTEFVIEICQRLDGLPLALELAAARIKLFTPQILAKKLSLKILIGGAKDLPENQKTMRDAIAWSYELLDESEKKLFRSLSIFVGGFTFESAEAVCESDDVFEGISSLVDKSLLQKREQANGEPRFYMLMTIKEFGLEHLASESEEYLIRSQHLLYFLSLAEEHSINLRSTKATVSVDILEDEHSNLRAAMDFALKNNSEKAISLAKSLSQFWILRNYYAEGLNYLEQTLALSENAQTKDRAELLKNCGTILRMQGNFRESRKFFNEALEIGKTLQNYEIISFSLDGLAIAEIYDKNYAQAQDFLEESLRMAILTEDEQRTATPLNLLGEVYRIQHDNQSALEFYLRSYEVLKKTEINPATAVALNNLGYVNDELGNYEDAFKFQKECIKVCLQLKNRRVAVTSLDGLASIFAKLNEFERAAKILGASTELRKTLGFTKTPTDMPSLQRAINTTKNALGEERYQAIFAEGQMLSFDEAIDFALREN